MRCTVTSELGAAAKMEKQRMSQKQTSNIHLPTLPNSLYLKVHPPSDPLSLDGREKKGKISLSTLDIKVGTFRTEFFILGPIDLGHIFKEKSIFLLNITRCHH